MCPPALFRFSSTCDMISIVFDKSTDTGLPWHAVEDRLLECDGGDAALIVKSKLRKRQETSTDPKRRPRRRTTNFAPLVEAKC
jgi:hypothetical protein